jgi:hypothetical protein
LQYANLLNDTKNNSVFQENFATAGDLTLLLDFGKLVSNSKAWEQN